MISHLISVDENNIVKIIAYKQQIKIKTCKDI